MQPQQGFSSPGPYLGSGGPPPVYMGGSPYGSSLFNGSSMPPYDVPFSGGSPYHFNYNSRIPSGAHYRPLHMSGPPPYHGGSMMGSGKYFLISFWCLAISQLVSSLPFTIIVPVSNLASALLGFFFCQVVCMECLHQ